MPFVPALNIAEVFVEHQFNGKPGVGWVLHYESSLGAWTAPTLQDCGEALRDWWNTHMKSQVNANTILTRIRLRDITVQNGLVFDLTNGMPITGTLSGTSPSANVAFSLKKNTGFSGKSFRGRIYQMGMIEADIDQNFILAVRANAYVAAWTEALFLGGGVADYGMVLASKYSNGGPRSTAQINPVTSITYEDLRVDTRRDRL